MATKHLDFSRIRALVVGDLMLDCFSYGQVSRISPEAPVPVLHVAREVRAPGGAANVAANIAALGAEAVLVGTVGRDANGQILRKLLDPSPGHVIDAFVERADRPTTVKTRISAQSQQIVRVDQEDVSPLCAAEEDAVIARVSSAINTVGVVCISDYAKGVLSDRVLAEVIALANARGVPVIVDPKRRDFRAYRGADVIKPNASEVASAASMPARTNDEAAAAVAIVQEQTDACILLTRSEKGMSLFQTGIEPVHMPTAAREVYDVSGAGDTVLAVFALMMAAGRTMTESMRLANLAAGIVVTRQGTAAVTRDDLEDALTAPSGARRPSASISWSDAVEQRANWAQRGLSVGFTNGCFDLLHPGHVSLLREAAQHCDRLIVGLNADASVQRLKGPTRPVQSEEARATVMSALEMVDMVVLFGEDTPLELIQTLMPDVLVKGADYTIETVVGADIVQSAGGTVVLAGLVDGQSTTRLVERANTGAATG